MHNFWFYHKTHTARIFGRCQNLSPDLVVEKCDWEFILDNLPAIPTCITSNAIEITSILNIDALRIEAMQYQVMHLIPVTQKEVIQAVKEICIQKKRK